MYEELAPKAIYSKLKKYIDNFSAYFPDYPDVPNYLPPKRFMWDIFATIDYDMASMFVDHSMKIRANQEKDKKNLEIDVDPEIYKEFMESDYMSKKRGRATNMLFSANINKKMKRRRKLKPDELDPFKQFENKRKKIGEGDDYDVILKKRNPFLRPEKRKEKYQLNQDDMEVARDEEQEAKDKEYEELLNSEMKDKA